MVDPSPEPHDFVPLAMAGTGFGIILGATVITGALWLLRIIQAATPAADTLDLGSAPAVILFGGTVGGMLAAATGTWRALRPVNSTWRQGGFAMVSAFASLVVSVLAVPADSYLGPWGVLGLVLAGAALAWRLARAVARAAAAA
jgi:hypothetical protein